MSYQQSSSSFYQNNSGGGIDGYGEGFEGEAQGNYSSYGSTSTAEYGGGNSGLSGATISTGSGYSSSSFDQQSSSFTASYPTNAKGFYQDPNPQIIRRPAIGGLQIYTQRVQVKFLQPPPPPPPGPLIIKEVRPPQPPPPPPLFIRQRPPPPPTLPPLVIREAPPKLPAPVGTHVITKMLPPLPVPPRSVIVERLPPLPPKPRDVIVERWLPYRTQQKRRVIIQRAPPAVIQKPRNIIIYYEPPKAQVVRRFQNLGVQVANPSDYVARYGTQLEDAQTLISHARQVGVVEDISPPVGSASSFESSNYENYQSSGTGFGRSSASNYESSSPYSTIGGIAGLESSLGGFGFNGNTNGFLGSNSTYESYSSQQTYS